MSQKFAHLDAERLVIGFYAEGIHGDAIPDDAVKISDETYIALLDGQTDGKRMALNEDGTPDLRDHPPPPDDLLAANARARRDGFLKETDWIVTQQQERSLTGTGGMSDERFKAFANYRQALRDVPQQSGFPQSIEWPAEPE